MLKTFPSHRLKKEKYPTSHISQNFPAHSQEKNVSMGLFDRNQLNECPWPENQTGSYAKKFFTPLIQNGVSNYIKNIQTDLRILVYDQYVFPVTINHTEYENSYVCSPYSYYVSYGRDSLKLLTQGISYYFLQSLLWGADKVLRYCQINKVVIINNWLFSTNLNPPIEDNHLKAIVAYLQDLFPDHTIMFRSIDPQMSPTYYKNLEGLKFSLIASREIFFIKPDESTLMDSRLFKSDVRLLKNSGYEIIDGEQLQKEEITNLLKLYQNVYIDKYSHLNPQFTKEFLDHALNEKLMHFKALKKEGRIDGIVGYIIEHGKMFCPFFGYDRLIPKEIGLYRLLSTVLMLEAHEHKLCFHLSSGASTFKKIRKAESCIEYTAVFHKHLRLKRRFPWLLLKSICNSIGKIFMKRY